jgi:putative SOS response-associated peptidase YedK
MFQDAFKRTRCLIPASGYYEWQDTSGGKQPYCFNELRARRPVKP